MAVPLHSIVDDVVFDRPLDLSAATAAPTLPPTSMITMSAEDAAMQNGVDAATKDSIDGAGATQTTRLDTGLVYSALMMMHAYPTTDLAPDGDHPEAPERIARAFLTLKQNGCVARMKRIQPREVHKDEVALVHENGIWEGVYRSQCEAKGEPVAPWRTS